MMDNYDKNVEPIIRCSCKDKCTNNCTDNINNFFANNCNDNYNCLCKQNCMFNFECNYENNNYCCNYDISSRLDDTTNKSYQLVCKAKELEIKIKKFTNNAISLKLEEEEYRLKANQLHYQADIIWRNIANLENEYKDLMVLAGYYSSKSKESNLNRESFNKYNCKY